MFKKNIIMSIKKNDTRNLIPPLNIITSTLCYIFAYFNFTFYKYFNKE